MVKIFRENRGSDFKSFINKRTCIVTFSALIVLVFISSIVFAFGPKCDEKIEEKYGVCVYQPEIITGKFINVNCVRQGGSGENISVYVELFGLNDQKIILPISGNECPAVSVGGSEKTTTIIFEHCGYWQYDSCCKKIVKSIIEN